MGDFISNPAAPGVHGGIGKVDAVAGAGKLIASFCHDLDGQGHIIKPAAPTEASSVACQGDGDSAGGVDPASLRPW